MKNNYKAMMNLIIKHKDKMSTQRYRTMIGQVKAGQGEGAMVGLARMMAKEAPNNSKERAVE